MKRLCLIIAVALFSGALNAQAHFALDPFDKIEVRNTFKVTLIPSDRHEIVFPDTAWFEDLGVNPSDLYTVQAGTLRLAFKVGNHRGLGQLVPKLVDAFHLLSDGVLYPDHSVVNAFLQCIVCVVGEVVDTCSGETDDGDDGDEKSDEHDLGSDFHVF